MTTKLAAGRELDALVAEKVMGWVIAHYSVSGLGFVTGRHVGYNPATTNYYELPNGIDPDGIKRSDLSCDASYWSPSNDIAAAFSVLATLRAMSRGARAELTDRGFIGYTYGYTTADDPEGREHVDGWTCELRDCDAPWGLVQRGAPTLPEAICRAALALVAGAS